MEPQKQKQQQQQPQQQQKRKLLQFNGVTDGRRMKAREDNGEKTATKIEAEVDEFFAIIRQLHSAARYFQKESDNGVGGVHKLTEKAPSWKPVFELSDFGEKGVNKCRDQEEKKVIEEEEEEECADFDLNLDPEADTNSI